MNVARRHGAWIWLAVAMLLIAVIQIVALVHQEPPPPLDTRSARPDGGLALSLWLRRAGYRVSSETASTPPATGTLMILEPRSDVSSSTAASLKRWIGRGGRLVVVTDGTGTTALLNAFGATITTAPAGAARLEQPLLLAPPLVRANAPPASLFGSTTVFGLATPGVWVLGNDFGGIVIRQASGRGVVWLVSSPQMLENQYIATSQNRRLALNLAGRRGSDVLFDQLEPGPLSEPASGDWLTGSVWGVVIIFGILVVLLYRWLAGRRLGPAERPYAWRFRPAIEYVLSIAGLLRRGQKREQALVPFQRSLRRAIADRFGGTDGLDLADRERAETLLTSAPNLSEGALLERVGAIVGFEDRLRGNHE